MSAEAIVLLRGALQPDDEPSRRRAAIERLIGEVGNGLRKRVAQGALVAADAVAALDAVIDLELDLVAGPERWLRALRAPLDWGITTYDALYVLLALDVGAELVTADGRLVEFAAARSLPVRHLAELGDRPAPEARIDRGNEGWWSDDGVRRGECDERGRSDTLSRT